MKSHLFINLLRTIIHLGQKVEATEPSLKDEWKNKLQFRHTTDYYSTVKKKKKGSFDTYYSMDFKDNMPSHKA